MTYEELYAIETTNWFSFARFTAKDGTVFTIGSIGAVASRDLAVVIFDAAGKCIKVCADHLFASQERAISAAKEMCRKYSEEVST